MALPTRMTFDVPAQTASLELLTPAPILVVSLAAGVVTLPASTEFVTSVQLLNEAIKSIARWVNQCESGVNPALGAQIDYKLSLDRKTSGDVKIESDTTVSGKKLNAEWAQSTGLITHKAHAEILMTWRDFKRVQQTARELFDAIAQEPA